MIYEAKQAPTRECHASTLAQTESGLIAAWFGGEYEKHTSVGIWSSLHRDGRWQSPREIANGAMPGGEREPCWNPVLFQPANAPLMLFYKVGHSIAKWRTCLRTSTDEGITWSAPTTLTDPVMGPVKNKPIQLKDGSILYGGSDEPTWQSWQVYFSRSDDRGQSWSRVGPCNNLADYQAIQPTLLVHNDNIVALCRTRQNHIAALSSTDQGLTWQTMSPTTLPNPNSGIDAVTLQDGRHLLVYNHTNEGRTPLNVAISEDLQQWQVIETLENVAGEYSYPAVIQANDGLVHITYTWNRTLIQHKTIDPTSA